MTGLVVLVVAVLVLACAAAWLLPPGSPGLLVSSGALVGGIGLLGLVAVLEGSVTPTGSELARTLMVPMSALAVLGGGPVAATVLHLADGPGSHPGPVENAAEVLRGGAWIGVLERVGVFATLVAGWPEGLAVVLALKGLGRYSELRSGEVSTRVSPARRVEPVETAGSGVADRFIIGTFCSVLWAAACAGVLVGLISG
jgi:hypothetical protein